MVDISKIEEKINTVEAGKTEISMRLGGVQFQSMLELMEFAKLMAVSGVAVPVHLRANPGACLAICTKALRFGFDPFSLAEHSYSMKKGDEETIAYDSFVIHAVIEAHAPIEGRLQITFDGEGDARKCTVSAVAKGSKEPLTLTSPTIGERKAAIGKSDKGYLKGSPLWLTKPDQQLAYDTRRDFCRRYFPETLLGWYDREELEEHEFSEAKDITPPQKKPDIAKRLAGPKGKRGFKADNVETATNGGTKSNAGETVNPETGEITTDEPVADPAELQIPDAFEMGKRDREANKSLMRTPDEFKDKPPFIEAWKAGWNEQDAAMQGAGG